MADVTFIAEMLVWVSGILLYLGAIRLIANKSVSIRKGLPLAVIGQGAFLVGSYYLGVGILLFPLLLLVIALTALRLRSFRTA